MWIRTKLAKVNLLPYKTKLDRQQVSVFSEIRKKDVLVLD